MKDGDQIAIVLTAAIIVSRGSTAVEGTETRRQQYLAAARFYARFAPVFFLENSGYDLLNDAEFSGLEGVRLRPIQAQEGEARGKGYREFHAIDLWYDTEREAPSRFLKITGRYLFSNIEALLEECRQAPQDMLLFDRYRRDRVALTSIFSASWAGYGKYLRGLYEQVDDPAGMWIEHVVYRALEATGALCHSFAREPDVSGISGSSGRGMRVSRAKYFLRQVTRMLNRLFTRKYLYLRGKSLNIVKRIALQAGMSKSH